MAKLFFAYGIGNSLFFPLSVGATAVLEPRPPDARAGRRAARADRPTMFFGVPTFFAALLAADLPADTFASVRLGDLGGRGAARGAAAALTDRFGVEILDGIGSTEALHIFLSNRPATSARARPGGPVPGYDVEIRDEDGAPVAPAEPGRCSCAGESIATGYWCRTDATRAVFQGEWLRTGDTYVRDADGRYTCLGRSDDMLKAGGIWVSPAEVEARLLEHPGVAEAAVVGGADADGLDKPVAAVVLRAAAPPTAEELVAFCREGLAHFKAPRAVVFVDDCRKTATGKMQRFKVRRARRRAGPAHAVAETTARRRGVGR